MNHDSLRPEPAAEAVPPDGDGLDLERLMAEIRDSLARRRLGGAADLPGTSAEFNAELRAAGLRRVEKFANIAGGVPELPRFRGPLRLLARLLSRAVLYLSRFLTSRQRECNYALLNTLRTVHQELARREEQHERQLRQLRADLERMVEERLSEHGRKAA